MREEINIFFTSLMFYTRIPCPFTIVYNPDHINKATRYFPLIGWIVGVISFVTFWLSSLLFDTAISVVFSLLAGVLTTGAFHEDGLSDVADGFGGGWTKERILVIMKDSRVGAYGVIASVLLFLMKYAGLSQLFTLAPSNDIGLMVLLFVAYHSLSRLTAISICFISEYARDDATSKVKPIAKTHGLKEIFGAFIFGLIPLGLLCTYNLYFSITIIPLIVLALLSKRYFEKWLDGYTGDCLGAVQQIAECVSILSFIALWKFM
ncbi:adenosylcobinamide-GDP ribazoletransferase [Flammeovirga sp. EKP202]|uniref:adenosylcobinamide-GDP ribazoletransferase n=1 Tax=Flammeovirga sp. EKP202 TaxID=2770592 RepID=UPI00165EE3F1|nr:adenosylcobinamide-GDP ribazoletransferase [Flammeovirga sp. EKP202]MBD0404370.1 adenosylcobinamide-GDP ribazoletransferase [Flammeovirga sp. EKP202]